MDKSNGEMDELEILQRETEEMVAKRHKVDRARQESTDEGEAESIPPLQKGETSGGDGFAAGELSGQLEMYLKEMEEAARERPALALLAALGLGILIGQLMSRK